VTASEIDRLAAAGTIALGLHRPGR